MRRGVPSGVKTVRQDGVLKVSLQDATMIRVLYATGAILLLPFAIIMLTKPTLIGIHMRPMEWWLVLPVWAIATVILGHLYMRKTILLITPDLFKVVHLPWFIPFTVSRPSRGLRIAQIDTKIKEHKNKHGEVVYTSYTFHVQASFTDSHVQPTMYVTSDEAQAVYLQNIVNQHIKEA